jgi:hypothetical protein
MKSHIWAQAATNQDLDDIKSSLLNTENNLLDPEVLGYPTTVVLKAHKDGKNIVFLPIQSVFMLESLGILRDNAGSIGDIAVALKELVQVVRYEATKSGVRELYMLCSEPSTVKFAEHNGFERVNIPVFRMKVK